MPSLLGSLPPSSRSAIVKWVEFFSDSTTLTSCASFFYFHSFLRAMISPREFKIFGRLSSPLPCKVSYAQTQRMFLGKGHYSAYQTRKTRSQDSVAASSLGSTGDWASWARILFLCLFENPNPGARVDEPAAMHGPRQWNSILVFKIGGKKPTAWGMRHYWSCL